MSSSQTGAVELEAGRELDALVAERVTGARWVAAGGRRALIDDGGAVLMFEFVDGSEPTDNLPRYSTRIKDAWKVVEKMRADGYTVTVEVTDKYVVDVMWREAGAIYRRSAEANTAPLAIARAALATLDTREAP